MTGADHGAADVTVFRRRRTLFVTWTPASHGSSRTRQLARALGIAQVRHLGAPWGSTSRSAPLRYLLQAGWTLGLLWRTRPDVVFVQSPPSHSVLLVRWYCRITGGRYIVDAHSDAMQRRVWLEPSWLHRPATRDALVTLVHDEHFQRLVEGRGGRVLVLKDPIGSYEWEDHPLPEGFNVAVVNRFAADEPVEEVLAAAVHEPSVRFHVTGDPARAPAGLVERAPANVVFTGFLPERRYYGLLKSSHAVMALTTRDHTFQCGANEALSLGRPVITSDWPTLRDYFSQGAVFVDGTAEGILAGVRRMVAGHAAYEREIRELRGIRRAAWEERAGPLAAMVESAFRDAGRPGR